MINKYNTQLPTNHFEDMEELEEASVPELLGMQQRKEVRSAVLFHELDVHEQREQLNAFYMVMTHFFNSYGALQMLGNWLYGTYKQFVYAEEIVLPKLADTILRLDKKPAYKPQYTAWLSNQMNEPGSDDIFRIRPGNRHDKSIDDDALERAQKNMQNAVNETETLRKMLMVGETFYDELAEILDRPCWANKLVEIQTAIANKGKPPAESRLAPEEKEALLALAAKHQKKEAAKLQTTA